MTITKIATTVQTRASIHDWRTESAPVNIGEKKLPEIWQGVASPTRLLPCPTEPRNEQEDCKGREEPGPTAEFDRGWTFGTEHDIEHRCGCGKHSGQQQRYHVPSRRNTPANHPPEETQEPSLALCQGQHDDRSKERSEAGDRIGKAPSAYRIHAHQDNA
jgi:hypothetical protein